MNDQTYTIRNLIRLHVGILPVVEAERLLALCAENPAVQKHRDKVRRGLKYLERRPPVAYRYPLNSQDLAEWLDNPLTEGAVRIDEAAKTSDTLLINLLELFRFHHLDCQIKPTSERLRTRLLNLVERLEPLSPEQKTAEDRVAAEPVAVEPVAVEPVAVEPVAVEPVAVEPVAVEPVAVEPVAVEPVAVEPVAVEPVAVEPVAVEPVAVEPVAVEPVAKPMASSSAVSAVESATDTKQTVADQSQPIEQLKFKFKPLPKPRLELEPDDFDEYEVSEVEQDGYIEAGELRWRQLLVPLAAGLVLLVVGWVWFGAMNKGSQTQFVDNVETQNDRNVPEGKSAISGSTETSIAEKQPIEKQPTPNSGIARNTDQPNDTDQRDPMNNDEPPKIAATNEQPLTVGEKPSPPELPQNSRAKTVVDDRFTPTLDWQSIKGVIAVGNPEGDELAGVKAPRNTGPKDRFVTLPESWGEALLDNQSTLILDEDTSLTLNRLKNKSNVMEVVLFNGRMALKNLPANTDLRVTAGEAQWFVETKEESTVGVDYSGLTPVFFQRSGENIINGQRIKGREQSTWQNDSYQFTALTLPVTWISGPRGRVFNEDNAALLVAQNLSRELDTFANRKNLDPQTAKFLLQARLSAVPHRAYELMQSSTPGQSELVFEWLLSQLDTARRPLIVRMLAEKTGDRQQVQNVLHSFRQLRNPQSIGVELIDDACRHLTSQELFFRVAAKQFLLKLSNNSNPVNYDVHDPPPAREEKARRWKSALKGRGKSPRKR